MKKFVSTLVLAGLAVATSANAAVIINEVYPGGGASSGSPAYTRDFVELYNTGTSQVDLSGFRLTYASATGNFGTTNNVAAFGTGSYIGAGDYLLLFTGTAGTAGATPPTNNYAGGVANLSGTAGSLTLLDASSAQVDTVGYGTTVTSPDSAGLIKFEGTKAPAPSSTAASISRTGFSDTNFNGTDFTSGTPSPTAGTNSLVVVPEPTTLAAIAGLGIVGGLRRRRA